MKERKKKNGDFLSWYWDRLKHHVCPHCNNGIKKVFRRGYAVHAYPCSCELYRGTLERMKVVSLDEYRTAKSSYDRVKKENPNFGMPFGLYCIFMSRYKAYLKAKLRERLREKMLSNNTTSSP
jgi:hypothetical protein